MEVRPGDRIIYRYFGLDYEGRVVAVEEKAALIKCPGLKAGQPFRAARDQLLPWWDATTDYAVDSPTSDRLRQHPLYLALLKCPPYWSQTVGRRSDTRPEQLFWLGYDGVPNVYVPYSVGHAAWLAGHDYCSRGGTAASRLPHQLAGWGQEWFDLQRIRAFSAVVDELPETQAQISAADRGHPAMCVLGRFVGECPFLASLRAAVDEEAYPYAAARLCSWHVLDVLPEGSGHYRGQLVSIEAGVLVSDGEELIARETQWK